jgi:hypothetical protein
MGTGEENFTQCNSMEKASAWSGCTRCPKAHISFIGDEFLAVLTGGGQGYWHTVNAVILFDLRCEKVTILAMQTHSLRGPRRGKTSIRPVPFALFCPLVGV